MEDIKNIIESFIFISEEPISLDRIRKLLPETDIREIKQGIIELIDEFENRNGGFHLREVAGGYQFRSRPEYRQWISLLVQPNPVRLSKAALETLAIVAYRQPIIRADVEHIRGVDSGGIIRMLMERKLIRVLGRKDIPGRPLIYATTKHFLELFDLKDLKDLPSLKEIEEFGKHESEPAESHAQEPLESPVESPEILELELENDPESVQETENQSEAQADTISVSELESELKAIVIPKIDPNFEKEQVTLEQVTPEQVTQVTNENEISELHIDSTSDTDTKSLPEMEAEEIEKPSFGYDPNSDAGMMSESESGPDLIPEDDIESKFKPKTEFKR